jgi:hypothetical protein
MSAIRSRIRSSATRASARARRAPVHAWIPRPERPVLTSIQTFNIELGGMVETTGIAVRCTEEERHNNSDGDRHSCQGRGNAGDSREGPQGALRAQDLLEEVRDQGALVMRPLLKLRVLPQDAQRRRQQPRRRLAAHGEKEGGDPHDVDSSGSGAPESGCPVRCGVATTS